MHKRLGFTIIELIVVITVIAILAAISLVSYNFIVGDARATAAGQEVANLAKSLKIYRAKYGTWPNGATSMTVCLSSNTTDCS